MRKPPRYSRGYWPSHSGTEHFWVQRATAIANVPLVIAMVLVMITLAGGSHATVIATLGQPAIAILLLGAVLSIVIHMRIGMQVIIEDYVHHEALKVSLLLANAFFCIAAGLTAAFAVLKISFGL